MTTIDARLDAMRASVDAFRADLAEAAWRVNGWLPGWSTTRRLAAAREAINRT